MESPVEPEDAEDRASPPVAVPLTAVASPELPAALREYEPSEELEGATPLSLAVAAPVLPEADEAKLEPSGASEAEVPLPEPPDWAEAGGCWRCPGLLVAWAGLAPWPELLAAPVLVAEAAPASPERAMAPASPCPATATAVLLPELPELALELDDDPLPGTALSPDGLVDEPPFEDAPPALPDVPSAAAVPVGAAATAIAHPDPPDWACELGCGWSGASAVLVPSWGVPLHDAAWASPDWAEDCAGPVPASATARAGPLPPADEHCPGTTLSCGSSPWLPWPDCDEAWASPLPETATAAAGAAPLRPGDTEAATGCGAPPGEELPAETVRGRETDPCDADPAGAEAGAGGDEGSDDEEEPDAPDPEAAPPVAAALVRPSLPAPRGRLLLLIRPPDALVALRSAGRIHNDKPLPLPPPPAPPPAGSGTGAKGSPGPAGVAGRRCASRIKVMTPAATPDNGVATEAPLKNAPALGIVSALAAKRMTPPVAVCETTAPTACATGFPVACDTAAPTACRAVPAVVELKAPASELSSPVLEFGAAPASADSAFRCLPTAACAGVTRAAVGAAGGATKGTAREVKAGAASTTAWRSAGLREMTAAAGLGTAADGAGAAAEARVAATIAIAVTMPTPRIVFTIRQIGSLNPLTAWTFPLVVATARC